MKSKYLAFLLAFAMTGAAAKSKFKAEDIVEPISPTVACISPEDLLTAFKFASAGEQTRLQAYFDAKRCVLTGPGEKLKVLTVENAPIIEAVPVSVKGAAQGFFIGEPAYKKSSK